MFELEVERFGRGTIGFYRGIYGYIGLYRGM